jgi:hypothetical protein
MNSKQIVFDNNYPKIDSLNLFSKRFEVNFIFHKKAEKIFISRIKKLIPKVKVKTEIIATTYFEPVLMFEPRKKCVLRFRQKIVGGLVATNFDPPKQWLLEGPGNLEIKLRSARKPTIKHGLFLKNSYDLQKLLQTANYPLKFKSYVDLLRQENLNFHKNSGSKPANLIGTNMMVKLSGSLFPFATRLNIRKTYENYDDHKIRITLESKPCFYAYPISHRMFGKYSYLKKYVGYLRECPDRVKVEIKTMDLSYEKEIENKLLKDIDDLRILKNKYTNEPYYKMIVEVSKKSGDLVVENSEKEIEVKANFTKKINIELLMQKLRNYIIRNKNLPYKLFLTDPQIKIRGDEELDRTIIGWYGKDNIPHEIVTIIRLTKEGIKEFGFEAILKWKSDQLDNNKKVFVRNQRHEYLRRDISNDHLLTIAGTKVKKKLQIIGVLRKLKHRIIVQDKNGRNIVVSADESVISNSGGTLQQFEVEYYHSVILGSKGRSKETIQKTCQKCMSFFKNLLWNMGIVVEQTSLRKIDFVGRTT